MDLAQHLAGLIEYDARAGAMTLEMLNEADRTLRRDEPANEAAPFLKAVEIFSHIQAARQVWLQRMGREEWPEDGLFPDWSLDRAATQAGRMDAAWRELASELRGGRGGELCASDVRYRSTEGAEYVSATREIVTHVVNHGSYHRGQISSLCARVGVRPPGMDYIALTRRKA